MTFGLLAFTLAVASPPAPAERPIKPMPTLARELKLDGVLKDFAPSVDLKMPSAATGASSAISAKAAFRKDTVYLAVRVMDDKLVAADELTVTLFFPGAGTTTRGYPFRFGSEGKRTSDPAALVPNFAQELVTTGIKTEAKGYTMEIAFPARSLPRFQASRQLAMTVCLEYIDKDEEAQEPQTITNCPSGEIAGGPTRVPDELRKVLKVAPPADVEGIEARAFGWVGYAELHYPSWALSDKALTPEVLPQLISAEDALDPVKLRLPLSDAWALPDNRPVYPVVTGKDPYTADHCDADLELRLALYAVKGNVANRVLEWPAATCGLGRALSFQLSTEGHLTIGYSNGSMANFTFSGDHFERSELGAIVR